MQRVDVRTAPVLVGILVGAATSAWCTTVVVVSTADAILVGVDSKIGRDSKRGISQLCKLTLLGKVAAPRGYGYFLQRCCLRRKSIGDPGTLVMKVRALELMIREPLQRSLDYGRQNAPVLFHTK